MLELRRREFITLRGGAAAAWPVATRARQLAMPVVGFLSSISAADASRVTAAFYRGLNETGHVDSRNVALGLQVPLHLQQLADEVIE
jgi:putative ABC transport system substrate-binding protein